MKYEQYLKVTITNFQNIISLFHKDEEKIRKEYMNKVNELLEFLLEELMGYKNPKIMISKLFDKNESDNFNNSTDSIRTSVRDMSEQITFTTKNLKDLPEFLKNLVHEAVINLHNNQMMASKA